MKIANIDKTIVKDEVEITPFDIIKMYAKNKDNQKNPLRSYLVRGGKGSKRYRALPNALVGAFYYSYIFSVSLKDVTKANILFVNGKQNGKQIRETFDVGGTTYYALGSTSNTTTHRNKWISPQETALIFIRKNNISNDISLEEFFSVLNYFMENIEDYI